MLSLDHLVLVSWLIYKATCPSKCSLLTHSMFSPILILLLWIMAHLYWAGFRFAYTTIFGWYAAFLYLRTGTFMLAEVEYANVGRQLLVHLKVQHDCVQRVENWHSIDGNSWGGNQGICWFPWWLTSSAMWWACQPLAMPSTLRIAKVHCKHILLLSFAHAKQNDL